MSSMTGKVINLRRARKQKARARSRAGADANAARHGEAKPVRSLRKAQEEMEAFEERAQPEEKSPVLRALKALMSMGR